MADISMQKSIQVIRLLPAQEKVIKKPATLLLKNTPAQNEPGQVNQKSLIRYHFLL
jgi:hypothetical protein